MRQPALSALLESFSMFNYCTGVYTAEISAGQTEAYAYMRWRTNNIQILMSFLPNIDLSGIDGCILFIKIQP